MGKYNTYTKEQEDFLMRCANGISRNELTERFNAQFKTQKTVLAIKSYCNRRGLYCGDNGQFKVGHNSWQTGLKQDAFKEHYTEETFQKLTKHLAPERKHKIGDTVKKSGELWVVVSIDERIPFEKRIVIKRRYVYEQAYGPIPKNHRVIHLDGNHENCELTNLYCIPSKFIPLINKNHWLTDSREHTLTAILYCKLYYALKEAKQERMG